MTNRGTTPPPGHPVCPTCGYALGPFDEECLRCARAQAEGRPEPPAPPVTARPTPPLPVSSAPPMQFNNADFWIRVAAHLIDGVVLAVPSMIVFFVLAGGAAIWQDLQTELASARLTSGIAQLLSGAIGLLYYVIMNGTWGATLGKMAVRIKIVRADGSPIGYGVALARYLIKSILAMCTCSLAFLSVAFNPEYRGWHDQIVGTRVIRTE